MIVALRFTKGVLLGIAATLFLHVLGAHTSGLDAIQDKTFHKTLANLVTAITFIWFLRIDALGHIEGWYGYLVYLFAWLWMDGYTTLLTLQATYKLMAEIGGVALVVVIGIEQIIARTKPVKIQ